MDMPFLIVLCTCTDEKESKRIAQALVDEHLSACVNILPKVRSVYRWEGSVEWADETLLVIKTTTDAFPALRDRIGQLHSYETPEIVALPIAAGSDKYINWLQAQVR